MKKWLFLLVALFLAGAGNAQLQVQNLLCENRSSPLGIDNPRPRFSWQLATAERNFMQTAYEITVQAGKSVIWNSGKLASDQSVMVAYGGPDLQSGQIYSWRVRVWSKGSKPSGWSVPGNFQMGLLHPSDWKASWIEAGAEPNPNERLARYFRKEFTAARKISHASIFISAHGMYEASLNGKRVGDAYLTPGWTSYNKRTPYQAFDVTDLLKRGRNAIGVKVGNGWYRGYLAWGNNKNIYGSRLGIILQLQLSYVDGTSETIYSDPGWKSSTGPIRFNEIYHGETYDARLEKSDWDKGGFDDKAWEVVKTAQYPDPLVATENELIKKHESFSPVRIFKTPAGEQVMDFGQNLVGWVKVRVNAKAGDRIIVHHAEVLDKSGNFYTENLRAANAADTFYCRGESLEEFEPHFTFHGFRFIKVTGYPGELKAENFTATALYSDLKPTGNFICSNVLLNQLQHNIQWGQRGNFLDVPTDCPQRDERLGWTGDAQVFSRTATFNFGVNSFFSKWLKDVAADQQPNGSVPFVIPNVLGADAGGSTGWADVATIIPWNVYLAYGDRKVLEDQYPSMKSWVEYMHRQSKNNLWQTGFHFGDWLFYRPEDDNDGRSAVTDKYLIAQCFYAHSIQLLINAATVLGKSADISFYESLLQEVKAAFNREYLTPNGRLVSGTQTAYVLALHFDMLPEALRAQAADRLAENVKSYDYHLTTGFLGTPYLCHVLSRFGYTDIAFKLLMQEGYPSWLYPVKMGATTIWERWDGQKPDSSFQTPGMNSFNHYAYGAIGDWMYRVVAGLDTYEEGPGYKKIRIQPHIGGGLKTARASLQTNYGLAESSWEITAGALQMNLVIPANTTARVFFPTENEGSIKEIDGQQGGWANLKVAAREKGYLGVELGSGTYHFTIENFTSSR